MAVVQEDSAGPAIRASPDLPQTVSYASFLSPSSLSGLSKGAKGWFIIQNKREAMLGFLPEPP